MSDEAVTVPISEPTTAPTNPVLKTAKASEIAAKLQAKHADAVESSPESAPAPADEPAAEAPASEPVAAETPRKTKAEIVREKLAERAAARQQKATPAEHSEVAQLRAELERHRGQEGVGEWLEKLRRDPVAALREAKADPRQVLALLTKDAISPGSVKHQADSSEELKQVRDRAEHVERQFNEYIQQQAIAAERYAFGEHTGDATKYPNLAKLPPELRVAKGVRKWNELLALGEVRPDEYDRDLIADAIEADYEQEEKFLRGAAPAAPPASRSTTADPKQAVSKKPAKTITAEMASSSGAPRRKTADERKSGIIEKLRKRAAAEARE